MKTQKLFFSFIAAAITLSSFAPVLPVEIIPRVLETKIAKASAPYPSGFQVSVKDHNCSDQTGSSALVGPGGASAATDNNAKDPDCGNITFSTPDVSGVGNDESIYNNDFRIGTKLAESESGCNRDAGAIQWTPWASDGGGSSWGATAASNVNDPDCLWIYYETRALPAGTLIKDVRAAVSTGNGSLAFTPWARQGGGTSGYSGGGNISPARLFLDVKLVDVYDADYVSDTVPASMNRGQSGNYDIVMQNTATTWITDEPTYSDLDSCQTVPTEDIDEGETCTATVEGYSTKIKLERLNINSIPGITTTPNQYIQYKRDITREYVAADICISFDGSFSAPGDGGIEGLDDGGRGGEGEKEGFLSPLIKTAHALRLPDDIEPGDTGPYCNEWGLGFILVSQSPANANIIRNDTGTFPLGLQIGAATPSGTHTLQFQMVNLDNEGVEENFGEVANIDITIGAGLTCGADVIVPVGTEALYAIGATGSPTSPISVTMSSVPTGPTMINAPPLKNNPLILNSGNSFTGTAYVATTGLTSGLYVLTFTGDNGSSCQSNLNTIVPDPSVDLKFNNSDGPVVLATGVTSGTLGWETDNATSCIASTTPSPNSITPQWDGTYTPVTLPDGSQSIAGIAPSALYTFTLNCGSASDSVQVSTTTPPPLPTANIQCEGSVRGASDGPCTLNNGEAGILTWSSANATQCNIDFSTATGDGQIGIVSANNTSPGLSTGNLGETTTYTIVCTGPGGTSAPDSVRFDIPQAQSSFTLACTPASISLPQGTMGGFDLATTNINGFTQAVTFSNTDISPTPGNAPGITFDNNGQVPSSNTTALIDSTGATPGIYTLTFVGVSRTHTESCNVELEVTQVDPPIVKMEVAASNNNCGTIDISWKNPEVSPDPESFRVYHRLTTKDPWVQVDEDVRWESSGSYVVTHSESPPLSLGSSNYYAVTAVFSGVESNYVLANPAPIVPQSCSGNLSRSDKDVLSVSGLTKKTFNAVACSGISEIATLPNNALFAPGDKVTFQINVCNSGAGALTGISIVDTLKNLSNPTDFSSPQSCLVGQNYDEKNSTITFDLADIPAGDTKTESCSVVFSAIVTAPAVTTAALYRFQNIADITTSELRQRVLTPPYLFSITGGVPDRTETAPN